MADARKYGDMGDPHDLNRFVKAQDGDYKNGPKALLLNPALF